MKKRKEYLVRYSTNEREAVVQQHEIDNGWVVLKNGYPDFFCYHPDTKEFKFIEVKSMSQRKDRKGRKRLGLSQEQIRMHQYLRKAGFRVEIVHVE